MITVDQALNRKRNSMHTAINACAAMRYAKDRREIFTHLDNVEVALDESNLAMDCEEWLMDEYDHYEWLAEFYAEEHGYSMYKGIRNDVARALGCQPDPSFHCLFNWVMERQVEIVMC